MQSIVCDCADLPSTPSSGDYVYVMYLCGVCVSLYEPHKNVVRAVGDLKVACTVVHALFMIRNHFLSCNTGCQSPCVSVWDYTYILYIYVCVWQALNTLRNILDRSVHWYSLSAPYNIYLRKSTMYCFLIIHYGNVRFLIVKLFIVPQFMLASSEKLSVPKRLIK